VQTVLDNTFAGFHNHQDLGIDYYIHSLTKFAGGHSDTMGGVILGSNKNIDKVRWPAAEIGACLSPHTAYEIQKGLKTYSLRYERSCQNAQHIAEFLEKRREITDIRYPGLDSFPQKQLANKQLKDSGCVITFKLAKNYRVSDFLNNLGLIKVSPSLGTVETLAAPVNLFYGGLLSEDNKKISEIDEQTVRLSIGIESCDDLVKDIKKALKSI
jgi:cystathionine beta-lyase/cystathionine gamma-synthase